MRTIKILSIVSFVSVLMFACNDNKKEPTGNAKLLPCEITCASENARYVFEYNADNMLTLYRAFYDENSTHSESYAVEIKYTDTKPSKITQKDYWQNEEILYQRIVWILTYTNIGDGMYVNLTDTSGMYEDVALTVNSAGRLLSCRYNEYWQAVYQYDANGNYMGTVGGYNGFEYDTSKAGIFVNTATPNWLVTYCVFGDGFFSPNLLVKNRDSSNSDIVREWKDLNQDGYYTKMTEIHNGNKNEYNIKYINAK